MERRWCIRGLCFMNNFYFFPMDWVIFNVLTDTFPFGFVADDVFVIIGLPYGTNFDMLTKPSEL